MKIFLTQILILITVNFCFGQKSKSPINTAAHIKEQEQANASLQLRLMYLKTSWDLWVMGDKTQAVSNIDVRNNFDSLISINDSSNEKELLPLRKNKNSIDSLLLDFRFFGSSSYSNFAAHRIPLTILKTDTGKIFFLHSLFTDDTYNTIKLTAKQRAAKILSNSLIKELKRMTEFIGDKSINYFAIGAVYGSKDFLNEDNLLNLKSEYVYIISSRALINKYSLGAISEDDFINSSSIFLSDRESFGEFKRVKITIE